MKNEKAMSTLRRVGVSLIACFPFFGHANSVLSEKELRAQCSSLHFSQVHVRACLEEKANQSERDLKQAEQNAISALAQWDEDDRFSRAARAGLSTSNKSFTQYREAQCKFSASLNGGAAGNSHEIRRLACIAELNSRRAEQLRSAASELPSK
ncbi:lysozyme inhibitor LprI family protein [Caballeronia zhejiangensis]|jgi:hypothetical protein|uniref:lysozyme inhibitor LprI family protein n=2 Tax=Burkholderiaceae TaxID=119060 RepID=UPI003133297C